MIFLEKLEEGKFIHNYARLAYNDLLGLCHATRICLSCKKWFGTHEYFTDYCFERINGKQIYYSKHPGDQNDELVIEIILGRV